MSLTSETKAALREVVELSGEMITYGGNDYHVIVDEIRTQREMDDAGWSESSRINILVPRDTMGVLRKGEQITHNGTVYRISGEIAVDDVAASYECTT